MLCSLLLLTAYSLQLTVSAQYGRPPQHQMPQGGKPEVLKKVGIEQRLNQQLPLELSFRDETGRSVRLGDYFKQGGKPVLLSLVYYECPMLCNQVLNGQVGMMEALAFKAGREYTALTVSFDPRELPELAARKRETYLRRYGRTADAEAGWHFLTGDEANIRRLTDAVGFQYVWDEGSKQFAHASAIMVVTPEGKLSHYFYGIEYSPKDVRLALVEASRGGIGSRVDQLLLYCYHYDPTTGKFAAIISMMRVAGLVTLLGIAALMWILWRRQKREREGGRWDESVNVGGAA
ncbi:MAG TPA: SCO family protein [Pyrinomonadaceae bacterium]